MSIFSDFFKKEAPLLGLQGSGGGLGFLAGGGGFGNGYEILLEYVHDSNTRYNSPAPGSFNLPADYDAPDSAIIIYAVGGGGASRTGGGDEGYGGGGGGGGATHPGGYTITSGIAGGVTISYDVGKGSRIGPNPVYNVPGAEGEPGGATTVDVGGSRVLTCNGGQGSYPGTTCGNERAGGSVTGTGSGTTYSGGNGGRGASRPGNCSSTAGSNSYAAAGGGGAGGHASPQSNGSPGGTSSNQWDKTYSSGTLTGDPFVITKAFVSGAPAIGRHSGYETSINNNIGQARPGTGYQDGNSGGMGGAGGGVQFSVNIGGTGARRLKGSAQSGGVPDALSICGGGGGAMASVTDKIRYPNGANYSGFNQRTGANPGPVNPAQEFGFGNGGAGCIIIVGRVGDGTGG